MSELHLRKSDSIVVLGASRGIGAAFVQHAVERGYQNFHLVARNHPKLEKLKMELERKNEAVQIAFHACDLTVEKDLMSLIHELQNEKAFPRHWVICVGGSSSGKLQREPFESTPWEQIQDSVSLNLMVPMRVLHQVVPELMRPNSDGMVEPSSIVVMGAQSANSAAPGMSAYAAAKSGLSGLMQSLAEEVCDSNMHLSVLSPGQVDTELIPSHPTLDRSKMIKPIEVAKTILSALGRNSDPSLKL